LIPPSIRKSIVKLEAALGYKFKDRSLASEAITHKSFHHEHGSKDSSCNERLEFLGDAVIGLIIVEYLYLLEPQYSESVLAKMKSYLVCENFFAGISERLSLGSLIMLGKGEDATGGRAKKSILSDVFEAVAGAVFLDGGYEKARGVFMTLIRDEIDLTIRAGDFYDYKTELQEMTQLHYGMLPEYVLIAQHGADHKRTFTVSVRLAGRELAVASGPRKKEAETQAARMALEKIRLSGE